MLLGQDSPAKTGGSEYVSDVSEANFMQDVIEASMQAPVIVDFWAPWCGPCRQLGPALEAEVEAAKGKVRMAKVNIDENQALAAELRIQSIPTVYAFFQGRPVDGFQGALPQSQVKQFVEKMAALGGDDGGLAAAIEAAESMLEEGAAEDAAETFAAVLGEEPENAAAWGGLIRARLAHGGLDAAQATLDELPAKIASAGPVEAARAQVDLARQAAEAGPLDDLRARVEANADDHEARLEYAKALHASGDVEGAVDQLLESIRRDREWNDGAAKAQLFTVFDAAKPSDPVILKARRRLSSLLLA